ncbi:MULTISPECIES: cupin domain-containing protein [Streptomyces]|uniref:Cupin domain-containing protein n=1 Tax=Streptomyces yangpuensis TaxID=1648182 RepID=A0ABY5QAF3_9ACTN|nr:MULTISPECIES: cupin domain-containing protein [Streptomyces]MBZ9599594.1 cupin domain-containing protein [Streptomyces erythrochromogenes]UUY52608.1 cupin domain-containing protein [Streptomyces yangpuensis]
MTHYTFADLVGDEKEFFAEYFNKKPLLRKGALKAPQDILSLRRLDELVQLDIIRPPYLRANLKGAGVPDQGFTRTITVQGTDLTDAIVPEKVYELFRAGATIVWSSLNHLDTSLRDFTRVISDRFGAKTDCVAFLTPAGKQGFSPHHDPVDLFIVQTEGTKRWRLWNPAEVRRGEAASYTAEQLGEPVIDVLLEPGDVLYLPYDTPHAAAAEELASVHLSIMIRPRMWKDLLKQTFEELVRDPEFNEFPFIGADRTAGTETLFTEKLRAVAGRLATLAPGPELDRLAELGRRMPGNSAGNTFRTTARLDALEPDTPMRRTAATVEFDTPDRGRVQLTVNGHRIAVPEPVAVSLAGLAVGEQMSAASVFPGVPAERATRTAQGLARIGLLEVAA